MAEDGLRTGGLSSGLAVILNGGDKRESSSKSHLVSYCDEFGHQSVERTLEHIFDLPYKSISPLNGPVDTNLIRAIIKNDFLRFYINPDDLGSNRDGVYIDKSSGSNTVAIEESSICGDIRIIKPPLLLESLGMFSSARANVCVWKGKWMYEVILETSGIQQLGWATLSCPFTDHKGVGDADDSYAFDGKRVSKWNKEAETYGQSWVVGDVIGCCIDLDNDEISFYRNGMSLGVAFHGIRKMGAGVGYYPAISLSQGERCELNFGGRPLNTLLKVSFPFRLLHLQTHLLLACYGAYQELFNPVSRGIYKEFFALLDAERGSMEYVGWGSLLSFMMEVFGMQAPHDYTSLDKVLDLLLEFQGPYSYLALACHMLRREELMLLWWKSSDFELSFEGFLSCKSPNKQDLQCMMPSVWWPGSCEDVSYESNMMLTTTALSGAVNHLNVLEVVQ
ncbi:E3 ubiquitin-protein ligase RKP [Vitis vinifera]|uniref:E3 ubiquitin-protein ligase RKP n=1 Tax=Vitis vinifera TaxID=29760 RepID=A0A438KJT7_VITVI|nr:E3 ubiquitin-protein ligase RKP [Vitis vinifera]